MPSFNRRIVLASRPKGAPVPGNFRLEETAVPSPAEGQVLARTLYFSLDPYMRARMSDRPSYTTPVALGEPMTCGLVGRVVESRAPGFSPGDLVVGYGSWQDYVALDAAEWRKLDAGMAHPSHALGVLGMPGFTAWYGLTEIGRPRAGETVVVAAATGAVGAVVGQLARQMGCRVVGIAGGPEKCRYAVDELGFDACLDHRESDLPERLAAACPDGIDVYFENVGGKVLDAVLPLFNLHARVPVCGLISQYNMERLPEGPDTRPRLLSAVLSQRLRLQGYIISDHDDRFPEFLSVMAPLVADGTVRAREDVVDGLENAVPAFIGLLEGRNFGKLVVRLGE